MKEEWILTDEQLKRRRNWRNRNGGSGGALRNRNVISLDEAPTLVRIASRRISRRDSGTAAELVDDHPTLQRTYSNGSTVAVGNSPAQDARLMLGAEASGGGDWNGEVVSQPRQRSATLGDGSSSHSGFLFANQMHNQAHQAEIRGMMEEAARFNQMGQMVEKYLTNGSYLPLFMDEDDRYQLTMFNDVNAEFGYPYNDYVVENTYVPTDYNLRDDEQRELNLVLDAHAFMEKPETEEVMKPVREAMFRETHTPTDIMNVMVSEAG